ncbi:hypothetical protein Tco_0057852 [Tanacetum coccineum]
MVPPTNLGPDLNGKAVNKTRYRGMIRSLTYLTVSRPDIQFSTCLCARYQANPKESHLIVVKRIFKYLKGTPSLGLWYSKCLGFDLKGYPDSDYAGCNMDRKSTSAEAEYVAVVGCCANILWMKSQLTNYDIIYEKVPYFAITQVLLQSQTIQFCTQEQSILISDQSNPEQTLPQPSSSQLDQPEAPETPIPYDPIPSKQTMKWPSFTLTIPTKNTSK